MNAKTDGSYGTVTAHPRVVYPGEQRAPEHDQREVEGMVTLTSGVVSVFLGAQAAAGVIGIAVATINASIVAALVAGAFSTLNVLLILYIKKDGKKDGDGA